MTAITLNLLVEEQLAQEAEARDPIKLAIVAGVGLVAVAILVGVIVGHRASQRAGEADALQAKWDKLQGSQTSSTGGDTKAYKGQVDEIRSMNETRPIFAPQLALIKDLVPDTVQVTQIALSYVTEEVAGAPAPAPAEGDTGKAARRAKPRSSQHLSLVLNGVVTCARPEIEVDEFIKTMQAHPVMGKLVQQIRLRSISRLSSTTDSPGLTVPSAAFSIDCQYKERQ